MKTSILQTDSVTLSQEELQRYNRHLLLPEIGIEGQLILKRSRVLVIGVGGLGSPISVYLAAAGIGTLGLMDNDPVDLTNLQRQILYDTSSVGRSKLTVASEHLHNLNPHLNIILHPEKFGEKSEIKTLEDYDLILDGTDNFQARYLINDACVLSNKPFIYGSVSKFEGQLATVIPNNSPCYRCLFPNPPPPDAVLSCSEGGILGVVPGIVGLLQATEALKFLLKQGRLLVGRLLSINLLNLQMIERILHRDPSCLICGNNPQIRSLQAISLPECTITPRVTPSELRELLRTSSPTMTLLDVREKSEHENEKIPGSMLIPLNELAQRVNELTPNQEIIVYCKSGKRSDKAVKLLQKKGFAFVKTLSGGFDAYKILDSSEKIV